MKFIHSMIRISNLEESLNFFTKLLGLNIVEEKNFEEGKFTLIFLEAPDGGSQIELTYNWNSNESYSSGRNFGHLAFEVENIYELCNKLMHSGITILRPPRDGRMAFIKTPDNISIEFLQKGQPLELKEPWLSMQTKGNW